MIKEDLKKRLNIWCDKRSTEFSVIYYKELKNGNIVVKRHDGNGLPGVLHMFKNNNELESFLDESDELEEVLCDLDEEINRRMSL